MAFLKHFQSKRSKKEMNRETFISDGIAMAKIVGLMPVGTSIVKESNGYRCSYNEFTSFAGTPEDACRNLREFLLENGIIEQ